MPLLTATRGTIFADESTTQDTNEAYLLHHTVEVDEAPTCINRTAFEFVGGISIQSHRPGVVRRFRAARL